MALLGIDNAEKASHTVFGGSFKNFDKPQRKCTLEIECTTSWFLLIHSNKYTFQYYLELVECLHQFCGSRACQCPPLLRAPHPHFQSQYFPFTRARIRSFPERNLRPSICFSLYETFPSFNGEAQCRNLYLRLSGFLCNRCHSRCASNSPSHSSQPFVMHDRNRDIVSTPHLPARYQFSSARLPRMSHRIRSPPCRSLRPLIMYQLPGLFI